MKSVKVHEFNYEGGVKILDSEIERYITECVELVEGGEGYSIISCGDTVVFANKTSDGKIKVYIAKDYRTETYSDRPEEWS